MLRKRSALGVERPDGSRLRLHYAGQMQALQPSLHEIDARRFKQVLRKRANPAHGARRLIVSCCHRSSFSTAARIGSTTNLFSRARTMGGAKGASPRASPLSWTSATMEYRVP